ncbi:hypothetical protein JCM10049v2_003526 [Rhodotorula toruloides]
MPSPLSLLLRRLRETNHLALLGLRERRRTEYLLLLAGTPETQFARIDDYAERGRVSETATPGDESYRVRANLFEDMLAGCERDQLNPWVFVAVLQNTVYAHWIDELGAAVAAELLERNSLVRFAHHVLIFYTLACLKDSSTNIQDSWVKTSFEAMIASINDDVMYTAETALHAPEMVGRIFRKLKASRFVPV